MSSIMKGGLKKQKRHHVHLSECRETAERVGKRRGEAIILQIDSLAMSKTGIRFYQSNNGVWLVDSVPTEFIEAL